MMILISTLQSDLTQSLLQRQLDDDRYLKRKLKKVNCTYRLMSSLLALFLVFF